MNLFLKLKENQYGKIYTSLDVLDELFTYFQRKNSQIVANRLVKEWIEEGKSFGKILFSNESTLHLAGVIFSKQERERKALSFTDCLIIAHCREYKISNLISFDSGFHNLINVVQ